MPSTSDSSDDDFVAKGIWDIVTYIQNEIIKLKHWTFLGIHKIVEAAASEVVNKQITNVPTGWFQSFFGSSVPSNARRDSDDEFELIDKSDL